MKKFVLCSTMAVAVLLCSCSDKAPASSASEAASVSSAVESASSSTSAEPNVATITLPILDEIDKNVTVGTAGSFMSAVPTAVQLLDWGANTGLDPEEIREATVNWLMDKGNDEQVEFSQKLSLVDEACQKLQGSDAKDILESAGCENVEPSWGTQPIESIEAIMDAVGLR